VSSRLALRVLQIGAVAVVLAALPLQFFELDRFFVPKELVLHLTALLAGVLSFAAIRRLAFTRTDLLLILYLGLAAISAAFATNRYLGVRGLAISASSLVIFWSARALAAEGLARRLLNAIALAVVVAAVTSLLQAYGVRVDVFAMNRSPGGTLGNRNFIGHAMAFGFPVLFLVAIRAASRRAFLFACGGAAIVAAALVLTRSRAAWLACAVVAIVFAIAFVTSPELRACWRRVTAFAIAAAIGATAAMLVPNTLHWRSRNPYLDSVRGVAAYEEGSGRGRLVQYEHSLLMAARHPLFGAGPGNWAVEYPRYAAAGDPSLDSNDACMTTNPWPSSDWIAFLAERGLAATSLLGLALFSIVKRRDVDVVTRAALVATIAAAITAGMFDAVLLLAAPSLLVWATIGAASPVIEPTGRMFPPIVAIIAILITALGAFRSGSQLIAMSLYDSAPQRAAQIDPGNYRLQVRLARGGKRRCEHARAAHALFPEAREARALARGCGE
jgi:O-antigen ligase